MGLPALSVRVAFGSNPLDADPVWTEIGPASGAGPGGAGWVRSVQTSRGRNRLLRSQAQFDAGTATVVLDNRDRRFDPTNTAGPYYPNVQPEKRMQIGATWEGTFYPIWTGYPDDWEQDWPGNLEASAKVPATDLFKALSIGRLLNTGYVPTVVPDGPALLLRLDDQPGTPVPVDTVSGQPIGAPGAFLTYAPRMAPIFGQPGPFPGDPSATGAQLISWALPPATPTPRSNPGGWAFETWIQTVGGAAVTGFLCTMVTGGLESPVGLIINLVDGNLTVSWYDGAPSGTSVTVAPASVFADLAWHHVVVDVVGGQAIAVVDGVVQSGLQTFAGTGATITPAGAPVIVGNIAAGQINMADVAIYPTVLTSTQALAHFNAGIWPVEPTGSRFARTLLVAGVPSALADVDEGYTVCQTAVVDETQTKLLDYLQNLEQTEQGQCFVDAAGVATFQDRYHRFRDGASLPIATFGDGGAAYPTELPYAMGGVVVNFDRTELYNDIPVTRRNGILQEVTNPASVAEFTNRAMDGLSDLLMDTDADAYGCAGFILADTAFPQLRVGDLVLDPTTDDRLWPVVLGLEVGQVVTVVKHNVPGGGAALSVACRLEGVEHQLTAPRQWKVTLHLSIAPPTPWLLLDDPDCGFFDVGARWGW